MKRLVLPVLLLSLASIGLADEAADNGAKYLAKVAETWAKGLPEDVTLGMYVGRKWVGKSVFSVKAALADSGATYEMTGSTDMNLLGHSAKRTSRVLLAKDLSIVSAEGSAESPDGKESQRLTVKDGKWALHNEVGEQAQDLTGDLAPNATWGGVALFAFVRPEADRFTLLALNNKRDEQTVEVSKTTETLWLDGEEGEYQAISIEGGDQSAHWCFSADGSLAAVRFEGAPVLARPCKAADEGKDLSMLPIPPCARTITSLYLAIKRGDSEAAATYFDIEAMAKEAGQSPADYEKDLLGAMVTEDNRAGLPDEDVLEDLFAGQLVCTQEGDEGQARLGELVFKLHKTVDAAGKETWLIYGIEQ